jgi:hypothetical protein
MAKTKEGRESAAFKYLDYPVEFGIDLLKLPLLRVGRMGI